MVSRRAFLGTTGLAATGAVAASWFSPTAAPAAAGSGGLSWDRRRLLPRFATARRLQVGDIQHLTGDEQLLLGTLQGAVNRHRPELYFHYDDADKPWLSSIDVPQTVHEDPLELVAAYADRVAGAIVYDPEVRDSINVATTLAGLRGAVVASPELAAAYELPVVDDLRGRFTGQDKVDIYRWQLDELWPQCEHRLLTGLPPTRVVDVEGVTWREVAREAEQIRDESNRDHYTVDVSAELGGEAVYVKFSDGFGNDGWGASVASVSVLADGVEIAAFVPGSPEEEQVLVEGGNSSLGGDGNRFADGGNFFVYRLAPPEGTTTLEVTVDMWNQYVVSATDTAPTRVEPFPHFRDYVVATQAMVVWLDPNGEPGELLSEIFALSEPTTPYLGWFSNDVAGEWGGVDLAATQSVEVLPADFFANGTVLGGVPARISSRRRRAPRTELTDTVYVTMTVGEGDNLQYCQRHMRTLWDNPDRGAAPTNWTISPVLADAAPAIFRYYQETATENDLLVCGPSGAGYTYGGSWPQEDFDAYTDVTGRYLRETGLDLVYAYNNRDDDGWIPMPEWVIDSYRRNTQLGGIMQSWDGGGVIAAGDLPVIGHFNAPGQAVEFKQGLDDYIAQWDGTRPLFVSAGIFAWGWNPTDIAELHQLLAADDRYQVLLGHAFFDLLRRAPNPGPPPPPRPSGQG
ncbi:hypothetical protein Bcav_0330 [Beutenbergia cavernae DSM 12333]|uniref:Uncharacterized protein n=1 Tax=Beutenbergia cavernae (strain ATCC BAA-8 / DSM 12333 / CCUG 43141 / JCM 11478 / NBRC 16432 / NCIMB 13614 / HKI 0122) TaxID=471853 RepID=C5BWD6_BEUC1|nr:GxGYxYP domain-containing protein [Beutenbergia cavernae]ACQ78594.1 hypothetical protein Bcav_0330 [Beutenbergia cavernae DSM 12333]